MFVFTEEIAFEVFLGHKNDKVLAFFCEIF